MRQFFKVGNPKGIDTARIGMVLCYSIALGKRGMPPTVGEVVKRLRRERRLSQRQVEALADGALPTGWLARLESGRPAKVTKTLLQPLAKVLGVEVLDIQREAELVDIPFPEGTTPDERRMLAKWRRLPPDLRDAISKLMDATNPTESAPAEPRQRIHADEEQARRLTS